ncbi:metal cation efflux system protein CzcD [Candidatus Kuenenia stuttgartiensis]|jgi:cobalt-zinc-cadmium efflux system protein|uniref:Metal cation efflux system protein CzcD n=3 Tax=Candidatus Brocadiaceae TaxID=1127830 RepID=Q1Q6G6_KUEST|nr:cation transporter [Planctomycetia bacterium]MBZ0192429.1 cation diffusion facilitator family transporter [Candidatus Kuenenia stuttgartiensis]MCL4726288.1 cation diffusion facilitator family transporter [Candidatus Kuenenia stuttgartiensis]QII13033.1 metal cation efflux system protein CzcD [Candidatus Kuenenia stuttgartiensis]TVL97669.1 MAG: cation transporter [Candidatus Kuenenia stuttgartiensis]
MASAITGVIFIVEVIGGIITNSLALLSDAGHMLTHLFALLISLFAIMFASKPPTQRKTYGFYRLEILAALLNGIILLLITVWIFYEAYHRFVTPEAISSGMMFFLAIIGLLANISCVYILKSGEHGHSLNVKSAFLHMLGDTISSVGVIIGAVIIYYTNWYIIDPIISIMLCILILIWSYKLIMESVDILLEATPKDINVGEVISQLEQITGVDGAHDIHIWTITSGMYAMSVHIDTKDMPISKTAAISREINRVLVEKFRIGHTVIQYGCECNNNNGESSKHLYNKEHAHEQDHTHAHDNK